MPEALDFSIIDRIIKETMAAIESSKESLFDIAETAKSVQSKMQSDLEKVNEEVKKVIIEVDNLEIKYKHARLRLMEVSRDFSRYTEEDIKRAYAHAQELQIKLAVERERESGLRLKRDELSRSIVKVNEMAHKADELVSKVDIALTFLNGNLNEFSQQMEGIQQKQLIGGKIILAQEEERKRVAREIHDGPAQTMANVVLRAELCEKLLTTNRDEVTTELRDLKKVVKESLQEIRRIIFNLRPMTLDDLGLIPTVRRYIEELKVRENFNVQLEIHGEEQRLKNTYEVALFRLIQESLNNARKHAKANKIKVNINTTETDISVSISDDGKGFDLEKVMNEAVGKESFGLLSMKERIELLNGSLNIDSTIGVGTTITVCIPLENALPL
ncbi:MAG TPA: sensor histidine kinase [Bacillota bacterium]|nr:sensor histidine kinase [Bacillota bacterium]HOL10389.1 sensor histidine kinase [Bacillota bacterium]HPO97442.1 sensor histidine kinase [Bacillota bacterium]